MNGRVITIGGLALVAEVLSGCAANVGQPEVLDRYVDPLPPVRPSASATLDEGAVVPAAGPALAGSWAELEASPGSPRLEAGAEAVRNKRWGDARRELGEALAGMKDARLDVLLAGRALLGRAAREDKDDEAADRAYAEVLAAWKGAASLEALRESAGGDAALKSEREKRALSAVAEALLHDADQKRRAAEAITMPTFEGPPDDAGIRAHIAQRVVPWATERERAVKLADAAYARVGSLEPSAPPRLAVRAAARDGAMWGRFSAEFRAAPIPAQWQKTGTVPGGGRSWKELRAAYYAALDAISAKQKETARSRFETCQKRANDLGWKDELSKSCDNWLEKQPVGSPAGDAGAVGAQEPTDKRSALEHGWSLGDQLP